MVHVAIAGGTDHVGRALVDGLVNSREHEVFVFTRKARHLFLSAISLLINYSPQQCSLTSHPSKSSSYPTRKMMR